MQDLKLSIFKNLKSYDSKPVGLQEILWWIQHDESVRNKTELYRKMAYGLSRDEANKKVKESMMPAFSVAVLFNGNGKQTTHVNRVTGLAICDIDHVDKSKVEVMRGQILADPHTLLAYRTISGEGFRVIFRYSEKPVQSVSDYQPPENALSYRAAYRKGNEYFATLCGVDYDGQCGDLTRLSGMAHDPEAYLNTEAIPFIITDDEAAAANLSADTEPGKRRREYAVGTYHADADEAWTVIEPMLTKRNLSYGPGSHHQYVMHAAHLFNRFGTSIDTMQEWAAQNWSDYDQKEREGIIQWVWQNRQSEHGTWRLSKAGRAKEVSMITLPDIVKYLRDNKVNVIYNQITDQTSYLDSQGEWRLMEDADLCTFRKNMANDTGKRILKNDVRDIINSDYARRIHPVRDFIQSLPEWDKTDRVTQLAGYVHADAVQEGQSDEEAQELLRWALHKWLVATVAGWLCDEACNQTIFTLIGPQGVYKTTFFRFLLPPPLRSYYLENSSNSFSSKDDQIALVENCLVEIEEIDMFKDRDNAELKSLSTKVTLKIRRPYDKFVMVKHRLASLCATGNQERFLTDETGNRRWLCFHVSCIDDPRQWNLDYEQLYAQLRNDYCSGFPYWFDKHEELRMKKQNDYFRIISDEEQLISQRYRKPKAGEPSKYINAATIAQMISYGRMPISSRRVSLAMKKLGFRSERNSQGCYYRLFEMDQNQQQSAIIAVIAQQTSDSQPNTIEQDLPF